MRSLSSGWASMVAGVMLALACIVSGRADEATEKKAAQPPKLGAKAKAFKLKNLDGEAVELKKLLKRGPVVVAVLRGYPGYQCPLCGRQVASYVKHADDFAQAGATVAFIYPGPAAELDARAKEFLQDAKLPAPLSLLLDPDYRFVNAYGLRWAAPNETAYPSTFIVDGDGKIVFRKISKTHGDRAEAADVLKALKK